MNQWRTWISVVLLVVMLLVVGRLSAQDELADYPSFAELCREAAEDSAALCYLGVRERGS